MEQSILEKFIYSIISAGLFLTISNPFTYNITDKLTGNKNIIVSEGCPTAVGHVAHSVIFFILIFSIMLLARFIKGANTKSLWLLFKYSFYGTLLFFIITNTEIYKLTGKLSQGFIANNEGCPTILGLLIHTFIYLIVLFAIMFFPKDC